MQTFNVYLHGRLFDTVFYSKLFITADEVKESLINHDGYDSRIMVYRARK